MHKSFWSLRTMWPKEIERESLRVKWEGGIMKGLHRVIKREYWDVIYNGRNNFALLQFLLINFTIIEVFAEEC